jgi:hypothetical protein
VVHRDSWYVRMAQTLARYGIRSSE